MSRSVRRALAGGLLILGLLGLAGCDSTTEPIVEDGVWALRIDRRGGSEDPEEAFEFLPEASYQPTESGPTYRVVISEGGNQVSVEGTQGTTQLLVKGKRTSMTDEQAWYELTDAFAGGRFVIWQTEKGLQGELTVYGSGRPIIFSERGALTPVPPSDSPPTTLTVSSRDEEETARAEATLRAFFEAWAADAPGGRGMPIIQV